MCCSLSKIHIRTYPVKVSSGSQSQPDDILFDDIKFEGTEDQKLVKHCESSGFTVEITLDENQAGVWPVLHDALIGVCARHSFQVTGRTPEQMQDRSFLDGIFQIMHVSRTRKNVRHLAVNSGLAEGQLSETVLRKSTKNLQDPEASESSERKILFIGMPSYLKRRAL